MLTAPLGKQALPWDDIATRTNAACQLEDELTPAACYSRFFRNGPLVAKGKGEEFKKEWYVHMKAAVNATQQPSGADGQEKEEEGKEKEQGAEVDEEKETSKMKQALVVSAVEAVKGNFWASVAAKVNGGLGDKENMGQEEVKALWEGMEGDEE